MKTLNEYINESLKDSIKNNYKKLCRKISEIINSKEKNEINNKIEFLLNYCNKPEIISKIKKYSKDWQKYGLCELCEYGYVYNVKNITEISTDDLDEDKVFNFFKKDTKHWRQLSDSNYFAFIPGWNSLSNAGIDMDSISDEDIIESCDELYNG